VRVPGWTREEIVSAAAQVTGEVVDRRPAEGSLTSRAVSNTAVVLIARVVSRLTMLVMVLVMARHLGDTDYGRYSALVVYSGLVSIIADPGLSSLYTREAARAPDRMHRYLGTLLSAKLLLVAGAGALFAVVLQIAGLGDLVVPGVAMLGLITFSTQLRNTFYALGRLEFEAGAIIGETAVQAAMIWWGVHHGEGVGWFVWAYAASYAFTALFCLVVIVAFRLTRLRIGFDAGLFRSWLRLAAPFALTMLLTNLYWRVDVPILSLFRSYQEVGWYQLAYKPFEALQFLPLAIQTVAYPILGLYFHQREKRELRVAYHRLYKVLLVMGWPLTVGTFMLAVPIGGLFRFFPQSEPSLRILALGIVFLFVNSAFAAMLYGMDRQHSFALVSGLAVVVNLALNLALIPLQGYLAASANTVVTEAALAFMAWVCVRRAGQFLPWFRLSWRTVLAGLIMAAVLAPLADAWFPAAVVAGGLTYVLALAALGAISREELVLLARGLRRRGPD
jgi:O-antigen/teichoic acid export membrane protein